MGWQEQMQKNATCAADLLEYMDLTKEEQQRMDTVLRQYPMSVTPYYLSLIDFEDPDDPIRKMAIPNFAEMDLAGSFDTSGEADNTVIDGLQHKYDETAMLLSTNACAMYCRHCFRKRLVGLAEDEVAQNLDAMREYIMAHTEITNVLVSGGDALMNSVARLRRIFGMLVDIPHLDAIRIGSRIPVVLPQRITEDNELLGLLAETAVQKQVILVTQFNHPGEITPEATRAVRVVRMIGIPVRNQTVLLRGVNDDAEVLGTLLRRLVGIGIAPYYVFQCRPVSGVKNQFQVPLREGYEIVEQAKSMQSGLGKAFRYCMSHVSGKLEIMAVLPDGKMLFKYHESKYKSDLGRLVRMKLRDGQAWLGEIPESAKY